MNITINFLYLIDIIMHGVNCYYIQVFILVMRVLALGVQNVEKILLMKLHIQIYVLEKQKKNN